MFALFLERLRWVERALAGTLLVVIVGLVIVSTATRYMGHPLIWSIEVTQALFVWLCVFAADLTLQRLGHFSVDMFANLLPKRPRQILEVFNLLLAGALLAGLAWYGIKFAQFTGMRPLPMTGVSSAWATGALPVGFILMLITAVEHLGLRLKGRSPVVDASEPREVM